MPSSNNVFVEKPEKKEENISDNSSINKTNNGNDSANISDEETLDTKNKNSIFMNPILIFILIIIITPLIYFSFIFIKKKKENHSTIKPEHEKEVIDKKMSTSDIMSKDNYINKSENTQKSSLETTKIFSFDEYEKYRQELEKNLNQKKKS